MKYEEEYIEATTETPCQVNCTLCEEKVYECSNKCGHIFLHGDKVFCNYEKHLFCNYEKHLCEECYKKTKSKRK